jgi:hypothetical protein
MPRNPPRTDSGKLFPEFDDLEQLGFNVTQRRKMLIGECGRLTAVVKDLTSTPTFSTKSTQLKHGTFEGYRELSRASRWIKAVNDICRLQNECINAEHCKRIRSRSNLAELIHRVPQIAQTDAVSIDRGRREAMHDLVSYISAVLARLIVQTSPSPYWRLNVMSALIKRITMIKVILSDIAHFAEMVTQAARSILETLPPDSGDSSGPLEELDEEEECEEYLRQIIASEREGTATVGEKEIAQHCVNENRFRGGLNRSLEDILGPMCLATLSGLKPTAWEMCAVAYETGFKGFKVSQDGPHQPLRTMLTLYLPKALLYQDRDGEYTATSDLDTMNTAHSAFSLLHQIVCRLQEDQKAAQDPAQSSNPDDPKTLQTSIGWDYDEVHNNGGIDFNGSEKSLKLTSMSEIITVMVPLIATSPGFLNHFTGFRHVIASTASMRNDAAPTEQGNFVAFFRMFTSDFDPPKDTDLFRLSEALKAKRFSRTKLMKSSQSQAPWRSRLWNEPTPHQLLEKWIRDMDEWVIDETSVTINCGWYVWPVVALASCLALGGLAIGFSVGERINGVDPSNLATYLWVLGAFVVLVGKSVKVSEWSWNDFLLRRVRCKSVSEIYSITGISPQHIIAKLLHDDCEESVLQTRGPYNSVFRNRQTEGFSIDVAIRQSTLLLSGLTMLKVVTAKGHALVCLDSRRKTELQAIVHRPRAQKEYLFCEDIVQAHVDCDQARPNSAQLEKRGVQAQTGSDPAGLAPVKLRLSRASGVKWKGIQGIYGPENEPEFV